MRMDHAWVMVAISVVLLVLAVGTTTYAFGLFVLPVSNEFGLSRANVNTGLIVLNVGIAAFSPFVGRWLDHSSIRLVLGLSGLAFVVGFVVLALSRNLWLSAAMLAGPVALGVVGVGTLTTTTLVARWFTAHRARAMAIAAIGISLGSIVVVPPVGLLIVALGWRETLIVEAVVLGVIIALVLPFVHNPPSETRNRETANPNVGGFMAATPTAGPKLLRSPVFWMLAGSLGLVFGVLQTIVVSLIPHAQESGLPIARAASLISIYGAMALAGKVALAWIGDRIDRTLLLSALFAMVSLVSAALTMGASYPALVACSAILGGAGGAMTPAFTALLADRFGAASIGTAYGTASTILAIVSAACIRAGGELYDRGGDYGIMFIAFAILAAFASAVMLTSGPLGGGNGAAGSRTLPKRL
jgi:MFS family permease